MRRRLYYWQGELSYGTKLGIFFPVKNVGTPLILPFSPLPLCFRQTALPRLVFDTCALGFPVSLPLSRGQIQVA